MDLQKIISGGQTGVDRAALDAALAQNISVGGWCPQDRRAEDGPISERYPLRETPSREYAQRTTWNVRDSDGTLVISDGDLIGGTERTVKEARHRDRPLLHVRLQDPAPIPMILAWGEENAVRILNVAGPRASEVDGIYEEARKIVEGLLKAVRDERE